MDAYIKVEVQSNFYGGRDMEKDFICGANIDDNNSKITYYFQGDTYYFCSSRCRDEFAEATMGGINP